MLKILILAVTVLYLFVRQRTKKKVGVHNHIRRFALLIWLGVMLVIFALAFGPEKYLIYADSLNTIQVKGNPVVFAWEQFRPLPIEVFAKPVFLNSDFQQVYDVPKQLVAGLAERFPYQSGFSPVYFLVYLFSMLSVLAVFSRHHAITQRWEEAKRLDTVGGYKHFLDWANGNFVRRFYTRDEQAMAEEYMQSIRQRAVLKLDTYYKGFQQAGVKPHFLSIAKKLSNSGKRALAVRVKYDGHNQTKFDISTFYTQPLGLYHKEPLTELPEKILANMLVDQERKHQLLYDYSMQFLKECPYYNLGTSVSMLPYSQPYLTFLPPSPDYAEESITKSVNEAMAEGIRKFAGQELLTISSSATDAVLEMDFNCFVLSPFHTMSPPYGWKRTAGMGAGAGYKPCIIAGEEKDGGAVTTYSLGMLIICRLVIDGETVDEFKHVAFPDRDYISTTSFPGREIPSKDAVEKNLFDANGQSCINSWFAQMMGISADTINKSRLKIDKKTFASIHAAEGALNQINEQIETALRDEGLSELLNKSSEELYRLNQGIIDSYIHSMVESAGQQEVLAHLLENYADLIPVPDILGDVIATAVEATVELNNA